MNVRRLLPWWARGPQHWTANREGEAERLAAQLNAHSATLRRLTATLAVEIDQLKAEARRNG